MPLLQTLLTAAGIIAGSLTGFLAGLDPAWIALIGTLFGGVVLQVSKKWLSKGRVKRDDAKEIREELRGRVTEQKTEINDLEDEVNEWRGKYYDLRDSYIKVQTELMITLNAIKHETEDAQKRLDR